MTIDEKFWKRVSKSNGCWEWTGYRDRHGYGRLTPYHGWKPVIASRLSWTINVGPIPVGLCVLHKCDNPPCVNPDHLYLGTVADNVRDCVERGRHRSVPPMNPPGENNTGAKLLRSEAEEIVRLHKLGLTSARIAELFPVVTARHIRKICSRKKWQAVINA